MIRVYLSNIRTGWPIERQEAVLDAGLPGWRKGNVYRDILPPRKRRSHGAADLEMRIAILRPTRRATSETVHVAALPCLAWSPGDFLGVLAGLSARNATLVCLDDGTTVPPNDASAIARAAAAFDRALRRVGEGLKTGGMVSGERRSDVAQAKCATIRERWGMPNAEWTTTALCREAGVSKPTALKWLGPRDVAQRAYQIKLATAERNRKRKENRDGSE